ncbi:MAG: T9SS type A sorting domain-containing protein, partial [bacterium]
ESVQLVIHLKNIGKKAKNVIAELETINPDISITNKSNNFGTIGINDVVNNEANPFSFSISPDTKTDLFPFILNITADENYTETDYFFAGTLLLVDDDGGANYENNIIPKLQQTKIRYAYWETKITGIPSDTLSDFKTMIWFTGDDRDSTLTVNEQSIITDFLNVGGRFLLSGQNIGYDLVENGSEADSTFFCNYLHAQYSADNVNQTMLIGIPGDPITHSLFLNFSGDYRGAGNQTSPDVIIPINQAAPMLKYIPSMECAGLHYYDKTRGSYLIFLPFGLEGIAGPYEDSAEKFIRNCLVWMSGTTEVKEKIVNPEIPTKFYLEQNYPNPFNTSTNINYHLPEACQVKLTIFNIRGQKVRALVDGRKQPGIYHTLWDGRDDFARSVTSGIYFYKLETENFNQTNKMIFLF